MIVYDLSCQYAHRFEGWFGSSADYEDQRARGLVECPHCGSREIAKAPMAPAVPAKANQRAEVAPAAGHATSQQAANLPIPPEMVRVLEAIAKAQAEALKHSTWVGGNFAEKSRAMYYGEEPPAPIHGEASLAEARALAEEGVPVAPILFPVAPPDKLN
ncbi:MAG: DUF1178 family protein [Erythrobacter sp.]